MPVFKNITNSELLLPKEDGLKPSLSVKPATKFNGSEAFYGRYVIDKLVERQTDGWTFVGTVGTGPDVAAFVPDGSIIPNRIVASAADAALNDQVSAGTSYSAFGAFRWNVSGTTYTVFFSIQGDGTHGSGSTFAFGSPDSPPVAVPTVTGSKVNCAAGTITVAMTGACTSPQIDLVYEPRFAGFRIGEDNPLLTRPNFIVKTVYVVADDLTATDLAGYI